MLSNLQNTWVLSTVVRSQEKIILELSDPKETLREQANFCKPSPAIHYSLESYAEKFLLVLVIQNDKMRWKRFYGHTWFCFSLGQVRSCLEQLPF